jgi:DNA-binding NarL/FixJ family response regulator
MSQIPHHRILIVDDNPVDRFAYRCFLDRTKSVKYTFFEAELGEEGLELYHKEQPDCVLLDFHLPDLDGIEFLVALQSPTEPHAPQPVILLTGEDNQSAVQATMEQGAQDYLIKGKVTTSNLNQAIQNTIDVVKQYRLCKQSE